MLTFLHVESAKEILKKKKYWGIGTEGISTVRALTPQAHAIRAIRSKTVEAR